MPTVNGAFVPRRWNTLRGTLFDVQPPYPGQAPEEDVRWFRRLRQATAEVTLYVVGNVRRNYDTYRGPAFDRATEKPLHRRCAQIAAEFFAGEVSGHHVRDRITRMIKMFGLVVYSTEEGARHNWPMPGRELTLPDAVDIVDRALHGRWPLSTPRPRQYFDDRTGRVVDRGEAAQSLFDVIPPDDPSGGAPADEEDWEWYRELRSDAAELLVTLVGAVRRAHTDRSGLALGAATVRNIARQATAISQRHLDGSPAPVGVRDELAAAAERFGLITVVDHHGQWTAVPGPDQRPIDYDEALELVEQALRGTWPLIGAAGEEVA